MISVQFSHSVMSDSLRPHGLQHARRPCPSPTLGVFPNSCPLSRWCHPTITSSVVPFFSRLWSFPASGSFQMSQLFASGSQNVGVSVSASVLPMNIQDWLDLLSSKRLSRVFSNTTVPKHQFFGTKLSLQSNSHIYTWLLDIGRCYYYPILQRRKWRLKELKKFIQHHKMVRVVLKSGPSDCKACAAYLSLHTEPFVWVARTFASWDIFIWSLPAIQEFQDSIWSPSKMWLIEWRGITTTEVIFSRLPYKSVWRQSW